MASVMEFMQLCRLCLVKDQVNIPIFEEQGDIRQIFLKISACLPVKLSREDNLPKKICDGCSYKLELLYQFWNTSANSEKQLLKWLSQVGIEKTPTSDKVAAASVKVQPHSINSDNVVLKQEVVDLGDSHGADDLDADDLNVSNDAQDYILQQQQLPYQPVTFEFQQEGFTEGEATSSTAGPSATITSEAAEVAPKRKRRAAAMKALPPHIDSEEEDDVDMVETKIAKTEEESDDDSASEDPEPTTFVGLPSTSTDNEQPGPSGVGKGTTEAPSVATPSLKLTVEKTTLTTSLPQLGFATQKSNNEQQCEASLAKDPLLITKQESGQNKLTSSILYISLTATRETAAQVFIEASTPLSTKAASAEVDANNILKRARAKYKCTNCSERFSSYVELIKHKEMHKSVRKPYDNRDNDGCLPTISLDDDDDDDDVNFNEGDNEDGDEDFVPDECDEDFVPDECVDIRTAEEESRKNVNRIVHHEYRCPICDDVCMDKMEFNRHMAFHLELHKRNDKPKLGTNTSLCKNTGLTPECSQPCVVSNVTALPTSRASNSNENHTMEVDESSPTPQRIEKNSDSSISPMGNDRTEVFQFGIASPSNGNTDVPILYSLLSTNKTDNVTEVAETKKIPRIPTGQCTCPLENSESKCDFCVNGPKFVCANCKEECKTYLLLKKHFTDAHKYAKHFCQECGRGYSKAIYLKQHTDRHKQLFACYLCVSSFDTKQKLVEHMFTHKIKCDQCDKVCASKKDLSLHKLEIHKGVTLTCRDCNKTFKKYSILNSHNQRHHRTGEYTCKECGKVYNRLVTYRKHLHRHRQQMQVICEECGREFRSVRNLKAHQKAIHLKKKYKCNVCKKEFSTPTGRKDCQNKHAGIAMYKCDMCEKAYFHGGSLLIHKRIHTGEKPYICFVCSRRFYSSQMLLKHCLSHGIPNKEIRQRLKGAYQPENRK